MAVDSSPQIGTLTGKSSRSGSKKQPDARLLTRQVVRKYRARLGMRKRPLSFARFAEELNQPVQQLGLQISYQTVKNWEDGIHRPDYFFTMQLANHASQQSWQHDFALDLLAVQWPDLYAPASEIGQNILRKTTTTLK